VARSIVWSSPAADDLEAAVEFVAKDSEAYARSLAQLAIDAAESLQQFPHRGHRLHDHRLSRYRELMLGSYRLIYLVEKNRVLIVAVCMDTENCARPSRTDPSEGVVAEQPVSGLLSQEEVTVGPNGALCVRPWDCPVGRRSACSARFRQVCRLSGQACDTSPLDQRVS